MNKYSHLRETGEGMERARVLIDDVLDLRNEGREKKSILDKWIMDLLKIEEDLQEIYKEYSSLDY